MICPQRRILDGLTKCYKSRLNGFQYFRSERLAASSVLRKV